MKQYLPLKPVKRGFKVWAMADSLNGYLYDFNVYTGATAERETALGEKVVLTLSESVETPPTVFQQLFLLHQSAGETSRSGNVWLWYYPVE